MLSMPILLGVILTLFVLPSQALTLGLRCLAQGNEYIKQAIIEDAQKRKHHRSVSSKQKSAIHPLFLKKKKAVADCVHNYIKKSKRTADCSGEPPPSIKSAYLTDVGPALARCYETFEQGRRHCLDKITHLKRNQRSAVLQPCLHDIEDKAKACALRSMKYSLSTPPLERPIYSLKPLWRSGKHIKKGDAVYACYANKNEVAKWHLGILSEEGQIFDKILLSQSKIIKWVAKPQVLSVDGIYPYYPTEAQRKAHRLTNKVNIVLEKLYPIIFAMVKKEPLPSVPNLKDTVEDIHIKKNLITVKFIPEEVGGQLTLDLHLHYHLDQKPFYRCWIHPGSTVKTLPPMCKLKGA